MRCPPPRVAVLQDLSCLGRGSLTTVIPTLCAMGAQAVPIPTALLSTQTDGFEGLFFRDLTEEMKQIISHFSRLETSFRAIYTGFLGSAEQIRTVENFLERFGGCPDESGKVPLILIDPVMGDGGKLYSTYTGNLANGIKKLAVHADILTPNLTEAAILTDTSYRDTLLLSEADCKDYTAELSEKLQALSSKPKDTVITGIRMADGSVCNVGRDRNGVGFFCRHPFLGESYPGSGDLFASVLLGTLLGGEKFEASVRKAAEFVASVTAYSCEVNAFRGYGLSFEPLLKELWKPENHLKKEL